MLWLEIAVSFWEHLECHHIGNMIRKTIYNKWTNINKTTLYCIDVTYFFAKFANILIFSIFVISLLQKNLWTRRKCGNKP